MPKDPRGAWGIGAQLGQETLLTLAPFSRSRQERMTIPGELGVWRPPSGEVKTLHVLRPGMQTAFMHAGGSHVAWVELSALDLRGLDWQLHLTDVRTGADRVIARDNGARIAERGGAALHPTVWYDGTTLLYTMLTLNGQWELHRLRDGDDEVIAKIENSSLVSVTRIVADRQSVAWLEREFASEREPARGGDVRVVLAVLNTSGAIQRAEVPASTYALGIGRDALYLGTESAVLSQPRDLTLRGPVLAPVPQSAWFVEVGGLLLCGSVSDRKIVAVDLRSGATRVVDTNVTGGPHGGGEGPIVWQRRDPADDTSKLAIMARP